MILVIGGVYQGKTKYVQNKFKEEEIILNIDLLVKELLEKGIKPVEYFQDNLDNYKDKVITGNENGYGVVPIKKEDRKYRDELGYVYQLLSKEAIKVIRIWNGLEIVIKGEY